MKFTIDSKHKLIGEGVQYFNTKKKSRGSNVADYIVIHYTAGRNFSSTVASLSTGGTKASAQIVIGRKGEIAQIGNFRDILWHAGRSSFDGLNGLNKYSIGIEICNPGWLKPIGSGKYQAWFGKIYDEFDDNLIISKHPTMGNTEYGWLPYTEKQIEAVLAVGEALVKKYNMKQVVGHEDISPGRKQDPANGIIFPEKIYDVLSGVGDDREVDSGIFSEDVVERTDKKYVQSRVENLNVRSGAGVRYNRIGRMNPSLRYIKLGGETYRGMEWTMIQFNDDTKGWVASKYLI